MAYTNPSLTGGIHPNHYVYPQAYVFQISYVLYTVAPRYIAVVGLHEMEPRYTTYITATKVNVLVARSLRDVIDIDKQHKCVLR